MTTTRRCAACSQPIDPAARKTQRFCSGQCRHRAKSRSRRGLPEKDPEYLDPEVAAERFALLTKRDQQLEGKQRLIQRLRENHQADLRRIREAEAQIRAEQRREERAITSIQADTERLLREKAELQRQLEETKPVVEAASAQTHRLRDEVRGLAAARELDQQIQQQWSDYAVHLIRRSAKSRLPLAGLDQEIVSTWQRLRQPPRTPQKQDSPRRRNR